MCFHPLFRINNGNVDVSSYTITSSNNLPHLANRHLKIIEENLIN